MNNKKLFIKTSIFIFLLNLAGLTLAQDHHHSDDDHNHPQINQVENEIPKPNSNADCQRLIEASVNGLVCDFCARALEKVFGKLDEVAGIDVDLDEALVRIEFNSGQSIPESKLEKMIVDSGYNVTAINQVCEE